MSAITAPYPAGTELIIVVQEDDAHAYFDAGNKVIVYDYLDDQHGEGAHYYVTDAKGRYTGYSIPAANLEFSRSAEEVKASGLLDTLPLTPETEVVVLRVDDPDANYQVGTKAIVEDYWFHEDVQEGAYGIRVPASGGGSQVSSIGADAIKKA